MALGNPICTTLWLWSQVTAGQDCLVEFIIDKLMIYSHGRLPYICVNACNHIAWKEGIQYRMMTQSESNIPRCCPYQILGSPSHSASVGMATQAPWLVRPLHRVACPVPLQHPWRGACWCTDMTVMVGRAGKVAKRPQI